MTINTDWSPIYRDKLMRIKKNNWDLDDYKSHYPETVDKIDELIECGFNSEKFYQLKDDHKKELVIALLRDDDDALYFVGNIVELLSDQILAPESVNSNNKKIVNNIIHHYTDMIIDLLYFIKENHIKEYPLSY